MGKIVKYCAACEESFAEKFGFCPNCGQVMTAFEMNPVMNPVMPEAMPPVYENNSFAAVEQPEIQASAPDSFEPSPKIETPPVSETIAFSAAEEIAEDEPVQPEDVPSETKTFAAAAGATGNQYQTTTDDFQSNYDMKVSQADDTYRVTVIEEKGVKQRNMLLLGSLALMLTMVLGGTIYSLFNKDLLIGAIDEGNPLYVSVIEEIPMEIEEKPKKNDKDGGGGGGGGKEEQKPASKGRLVSQSENPITPPSVNIPQLTNPSLPVIMETKGTIKRERTAERPGLPGSDSLDPSNGTGRGGGIGSGTGTGIGGGNGTGEGNGNGSGSGNGNGNGNGDGRGNGDNGRNNAPPPPPPVKPVGVTEGLKIVSKPRANYTDAARQNQVQGTVTLRVTFTASGAIGSISPVSGLPYGLTEQAISAARSIRFEPAKKNGVAQTTVKQVQYSFTIY